MSEFIRVDNEFSGEFNNKLFTLYRGWDQTLAHDLVRVSREEIIMKSTPGDISRRFRDVPTANRWQKEGQRSIYSLYGKSLAGIIWYDIRPRRDIDAEYTFAIRMYEEARGKKLAHAFMKAAHQDFTELNGDRTVWLDVAHDNPAARHLYDKFGYVPTHDENHDGQTRTVMVYRTES